MTSLIRYYHRLYREYGPQGWWPIVGLHNLKNGENPTKTGSIRGYHPGDYSYPHDDAQRFEICLGAILTQNTSWSNVEKALMNLKKANVLNLNSIKKLPDEKLKKLIRPAGYFNQKTAYVHEFAIFYGQFSRNKKKVPTRDELLALKGIGPETADSMLLYAFKVPTFVVDAYTRRMLASVGMISEKDSYDKIKALFESSIKPDIKLYQEYHALIVEHAKRQSKK